MPLTLLTGASISDAKREMSLMVRDGILSTHVRRLAEEAGAAVPGIFDFVRDTFPYALDPEGTELFISPNRIAEDYYQGRVRMGDCEDLAMLTAAMVGSVGYKSRVMVIATQGLDWDHAVAQVSTPDLGWLNCDVSDKTHPLGWVIPGRKTYAIP